MLIVCPNCATSYQVDPSSLGGAGRSVRCVRCKKTWFASNTDAMAAIALSHRQDVGALKEDAPADTVAEAEAAHAADPPEVDAAPPIVPADAPAEASAEAPAGEEPARDDRGPAPLPEPTEYQLPPEPPAADGTTVASASDPIDAAPAAREAPEDIESVAARRMRRRTARKRSRWSATGLPTAILALIAINTGLIAWRADIVRYMPQTASLYAAIGLPVNLRGLEFIDIVTRREAQDGAQMLVVEGFIRSNSRKNADVPRLRFAVRNAKGHEIYSWTALPARTVIPSGATLPFRSRLASPPAETHEVLVRFFNRRDLVAGLQ